LVTITVALILGVSLLVFLFPVAVAETVGVFGLVALYSLCLVALCIHFSLLTIKRNIPFIPIALTAALLISLLDLNDNDTVRDLTAGEAVEAPYDDHRSAAEQFLAWYESRASDVAKYDEYPVYVVAAEGGGIYAAYQTAIFLSRLRDYCPSFDDHLFAISSVSGGSIGAAAYAATVRSAEDKHPAPLSSDNAALPIVGAVKDPCPTITEYLLGRGSASQIAEYASGKRLVHKLETPFGMEVKMRKVFANDFLSPLVAGALFTDFTQSFLPVPVSVFDRARYLEFAFERSGSALEDSGSSYIGRDFRALWTPQGNTPALLINATDAGSGRRVLISPFPLRDNTTPNLGSVVWYQDLGTGDGTTPPQRPPAIRLSTAATISARFPWVTPAATVPVGDMRLGSVQKLRLVDGGYIDNSGTETALDLIDAIRPAVEEINAKAVSDTTPTIGATGVKYKKVRLKLLILSGGGYPIRSSFAFGEQLEPLRALLSTRSSRAYVAIDRAIERFPLYEIYGVNGKQSGLQIRDLRKTLLNSRYYPLPLGWAMSNRTRQIIEKQSGYFWNCDPDVNFAQSEKSLSEADCIQLLIYHELNQSLNSAAEDIIAINRLRASLPQQDTNSARLSHKRIIECYRDAAVPSMTLPQSQSLDALMDIWDAHPEWSSDRMLAFVLATIANETGDFRIRTENLSFATAERIQSLWPSRFLTVADAEPFVGQPEKLAERVYGDRFGNIKSGDAWFYRGRGMAMILGRYEYNRYGNELGIDLLAKPELVLNPIIGARVAFNAYFPKNVLTKLSETFKAETPDWNAALPALIRVGNKEGIIRKSELFYGCISAARA
jgi:predicted chitinase